MYKPMRIILIQITINTECSRRQYIPAPYLCELQLSSSIYKQTITRTQKMYPNFFEQSQFHLDKFPTFFLLLFLVYTSFFYHKFYIVIIFSLFFTGLFRNIIDLECLHFLNQSLSLISNDLLSCEVIETLLTVYYLPSAADINILKFSTVQYIQVAQNSNNFSVESKKNLQNSMYKQHIIQITSEFFYMLAQFLLPPLLLVLLSMPLCSHPTIHSSSIQEQTGLPSVSTKHSISS